GIISNRRVRTGQRGRIGRAGIDDYAVVADDQGPILVFHVLIAGEEAAAVHMLGHGRISSLLALCQRVPQCITNFGNGAPEQDPEKWERLFGKGSCSTKE